ncbi:L,D-transpeptidase [Ottowia testudinis]|uniref:L,D-transpeptidase n=1 Tax=Ottowia testudinis TaxID=2816950 RepID=A0A975CF49_9BURK|nr:L,D-transpeptidase [Ottowia testudinis]QTD44682.1 L,D-transpeptidase [Ottowia testudinis]
MPLLHVSAAGVPRFLQAALGVAALALTLQASAVNAGDAGTGAAPLPPASLTAERFAHDVVRSADAGGRTFGIIDKPAATLWVFDAQGRLLASTPVLVGEATGDVAPPDIGTRPLSRVKKHEKITAAGRYITEAGNNHKSEDIVWLDYDSALSMHRVRNVPGEGRARRLQTPTVADNRISFGCVNIPDSFYDRYIDPLFSQTSGVVYVLPETKPLASVFPFATETGPALASVTAQPGR